MNMYNIKCIKDEISSHFNRVFLEGDFQGYFIGIHASPSKKTLATHVPSSSEIATNVAKRARAQSRGSSGSVHLK